MTRAAQSSTFILEEFFSGKLRGWGFTHTRFGKLANTFTIDAEGTWDSAARLLTLVERYQFDDGHDDTLQWQIAKHSASRYTGTETRLAGEAEGEQSKNW